MKKFIDFMNEWIGIPTCIAGIIFCVWFEKQDWSDWTNSWTQPDPITNELNNKVKVER